MISYIQRQSKLPWVTSVCLLLCVHGTVTASGIPRNECAQPPTGTIFCEDFEGTNPKGNFNDYDGNPDSENLVMTDLGPPNDTVNKVIRLRVPASQSGASDLVKVLPGSFDSLYARWYFKYETGFNFGAPNHGGGLTAGDRNFIGQSGNRPNGSDFAYFGVQYQNNTSKPYSYSYYRGMYQDCPSQGSCFGDSLPCVYDAGASYCTKPQHRPATSLPILQAGQWYCVEQLVTMGTPSANGTTANGRLAFWLDGQVVGNFQDLWIRTTTGLKVQNLWISLFHHNGTHSTAGELIDNIVVSTARIGCGSAVPVSPPSSPTNLRVS